MEGHASRIPSMGLAVAAEDRTRVVKTIPWSVKCILLGAGRFD